VVHRHALSFLAGKLDAAIAASVAGGLEVGLNFIDRRHAGSTTPIFSARALDDARH
jgi:hypothetical protein